VGRERPAVLPQNGPVQGRPLQERHGLDVRCVCVCVCVCVLSESGVGLVLVRGVSIDAMLALVSVIAETPNGNVNGVMHCSSQVSFYLSFCLALSSSF
jgi:hypothetical protein